MIIAEYEDDELGDVSDQRHVFPPKRFDYAKYLSINVVGCDQERRFTAWLI